MSFRNIQNNNIPNSKTLKGKGIPASATWTRNPSWLAMPSITYANEEVDLLMAVYPQSPYIAFNFTTSAGTYNVDWGDGTTTTGIASAANAEKLYTFTDAGLANTNGPVTFTDAGDTVNRTSHGYTNGMKISFDTIVSTTGITVGQLYYVVGATANTFQVSATLSGSALALTTDGSGTILPFKQAIIKITPTTGGATFSTVNLQVKNTTANLQAYISTVLDATISANCSTLTITSTTVPMKMLEQCTILRHATTNLTSLFNGCTVLQSVPLFDTSSVTDMPSMFQSCRSLAIVPFFNTVNVLNMSSMFSSCQSLQSVPLFNTASVTNMTSMFSSCQSLQSVPLFNTVNVLNMTSMFSSCFALTTVPGFDTTATAGGSAFTSMFSSCGALTTIGNMNFGRSGIINTSAYTTMFSSCPSLSSINCGTGPKFTFTVASCKLSGTALNALYTSLPSVTAQTITVSGNVGIATDTPSIATGKGWTVTGS